MIIHEYRRSKNVSIEISEWGEINSHSKVISSLILGREFSLQHIGPPIKTARNPQKGLRLQMV